MTDKDSWARLTKKIIECGMITGYEIEAHNKGVTKTSRVSVDNIIQLVRRGVPIEGVSVFDNKLCINSNMIKLLPVATERYDIIDKIKSDKDVVIGYVIKGIDGNTHRIDMKTAWRMAASDNFEKAKACVVRGSEQKVIVMTAN